ncbi:MAG: response regulator transcription factor [Lachnospiraceae bacterium]|nr:response regulator transcription factor [Lachnospiraceae bacterium]MBQ2100558.1 response regulator transcription factor [Lachnospiraceae bacterium]MBQ3907239.1 response regulator transcription factor [Lachnospiraceae bacterium]
MEKIKVLIADDIMILRQGLRAVLEQDEGLQVVALAENGKEAFEKCKVFRPDVVMMDMRMPDYDGAYGIKAIKEECPDVKVLVLTTFDDEETIGKALSSGADGYILKEMEDAKVIASVKSVYSGISVFGDGVYRVMRKRMEEAESAPKKENVPEEETILTARELDVVKLVAQGYDNKEIAAELYLAEGTVRNQISKILEKLELKDRTQLAVYAVKHGLDE